jgi:MarR-like DNA-binding transcriptional regulator SgrR of sgrS sRNA
VWSDGTPITADDLRRSADKRFVAGIDGPGADGAVTIRFTQPLPGWHRLWSGVDAVSAPRPGVWGGPFVVQARTPGLELVLARNDRWYAGAPFLDEVHLVLVPDSTTARQLLAKGDVDVVMPPAGTVRTPQLRATAGVAVEVGTATGWWVGLQLPANRLDADRRRAVVATVDRQRFVSVLLQGEASTLAGFGAGGAGPWSVAEGGDAGPLKGRTIDLVGENEEPMTALLQRSMQVRARAAGGELELRNAESDRVEGWLAAGTYDAAIVQAFDGPQPCWTCRWGGVDAGAASQADAGDEAAVAALQAELRDKALLLPLWRPVPVVAHRSELGGVRVNGYGLDGAWDAWEWFRG